MLFCFQNFERFKETVLSVIQIRNQRAFAKMADVCDDESRILLDLDRSLVRPEYGGGTIIQVFRFFGGVERVIRTVVEQQAKLAHSTEATRNREQITLWQKPINPQSRDGTGR